MAELEACCPRCGTALCPCDCDGYTQADMLRANERMRADLIDRVWLAQAFADCRIDATAAERERCAKVCAALEDEFARAATELQHTHSERVDVLRAQADGCAQCAVAIREMAHD